MEKWKLDDIYTGFDAPAFTADYNEIAPKVEKMNDMAGELKSFSDVAALVRMLEEYTATLDRMSSYANFVFSTDTSDQEAAKYLYLIETANAGTSRMQVRLAAFLAAQAKAGDITQLAEASGIGEYAFQLKHMAEEYAHLMSEGIY